MHSTRGAGLLFLSHSLFLLASVVGIHPYAKLKLESFVLVDFIFPFSICHWNNKKMMGYGSIF